MSAMETQTHDIAKSVGRVGQNPFLLAGALAEVISLITRLADRIAIYVEDCMYRTLARLDATAEGS